MIEWFENIDHQIVLFINGLNTPVLDQIMWQISSRIIWIPFYILLLIIIYSKNGLKISLIFLFVVSILVFLTDFLSVHAFKDVFLRYRPSHNLILKSKLHLFLMPDGQIYSGGLYGFISSHAANFSALSSFFILVQSNLKRKWIYFIPLILVGFSRIYLGVHYLSDVLVGYIFGAAMAICLHKFLFVPITRFSQKNSK
ncbi:MAG: phosphatase PAP2 family protein [Bacteroidetes bacterium]|nr:phosphatase PAP2 family protein [Bacteroidota bacterium]